MATYVSFGEVAERSGQRVTLCGRFLFWKSCAEKIQQNVAVERENQIVSIKKNKVPINQLAQKRGGGQEWEEVAARQAAGRPWVGTAVSLSTLQRKTGWRQSCRRRLGGAAWAWGPCPPTAPPGALYRSFRMKGSGACSRWLLLIRADAGSCFQGTCAVLGADCQTNMAKSKAEAGW